MKRFATPWLLVLLTAVTLYTAGTTAFGAGNVASIARVEGTNWRHGDIEDTLKRVTFLSGHKWSSLNIKRVYFGNWLRDYSQSVDVGSLKGANATSIRILVWLLGFLTFGYATAEFEVTDERLGVYRAEEHCDCPAGYAGGEDARKYDPRLRGPVLPEELAIDPATGMLNYIANEGGEWATSVGYIKWSFARSLHFGRTYTHGANKSREEDLCEALRCLGQGLHTLEDFPAHSQYVQLCLREMGFENVFPHVGSATMINLRGKRVYPLVTGTFGSVDFLLSVIGEVSDHVTQSEVDEMKKALGNATAAGHQEQASVLTSLISKVPIPGTRALCLEAEELQSASQAQASRNEQEDKDFGIDSITNLAKTDPQAVVNKIMPILVFRDNIVRTIDNVVSKIPGLEALVEKITETVTLFVMRLLSPYVMPLIAMASKGLKLGTTGVVGADASQQHAVFEDPHSLAPSHSILSNDHFSNILNEPAGRVACAIVKYVAPRIVYGWQHPEVPAQEIFDDIAQVLHHPAMRNEHSEIHQAMFNEVRAWSQQAQSQGKDLNALLSAESVRAGHNHSAEQMPAQGFAAWTNLPSLLAGKNREIELERGGPSGAMPQQQGDPGAFESGQGSSQPPVGHQHPPYQTPSQGPPYPVDQNYNPANPGQFPQPPPGQYSQPPPGQFAQPPYPPSYGPGQEQFPSQQQPMIPDPWANNSNAPFQGPYQGQMPPETYAQPPPQPGPPYGGNQYGAGQYGPPPGSNPYMYPGPGY